MARNVVRVAWSSFGVGVAAGAALACASFLLLRHHGDGVLRDLHATFHAWFSVLLGSSVLASFAAAYFNARAVRRNRVDSLSDSAYTAYLGFNGAARKLLYDFERFANGRPPADQLRKEYDNAHAMLGRVADKYDAQLELLDAAFVHMRDWPTGGAGKPPNSAEYVAAAQERLNKLEGSMRFLGGGAR